ncbi:hypothetical protein OEZ85_003492 [Tetradesmus obliquus]|uniref:Glycerophosphocholine acyltransferase 1 n=1 Tax=Tetradesmus obliquus TaxID=3088 RepID=A0ABY8UFA9_TETOB|nr:hypothetical protein OEZ85_003492 [Tetradesmus obliquus]
MDCVLRPLCCERDMGSKTSPAADAIQLSLDGLDDDIFKGSRRVASAILAVTQMLAFVPLFVIVVLQDVHLKMGVVLSAALCICLAVGNYWFHRMQVVKVYPKSLDTFLLLFYISLIPVAITHPRWMQFWVAPFHHGIVACFMWLSVLSPSWDNFTMQSLRDHLPLQLCNLPNTQRTALHVSQLWASVLTVMALVGLGPTLSGQNSPWCVPRIVCNYVVALLALLAAAAVQRWLLNNCVAAAQEWQQNADPEAGVHAHVGPATVVGRPLGPFTEALYPSPIRVAASASPGGSTLSTDSGSSSSDTAPARDGTAGVRKSWWQLHMPKKAAAAAAADNRPGA